MSIPTTSQATATSTGTPAQDQANCLAYQFHRPCTGKDGQPLVHEDGSPLKTGSAFYLGLGTAEVELLAWQERLIGSIENEVEQADTRKAFVLQTINRMVHSGAATNWLNGKINKILLNENQQESKHTVA